MSIPQRPERAPRVAAVGLASWDRIIQIDRYPDAGGSAIVEGSASLPGGTTANSAVALARLGASVSLTTLVGDDAEGVLLRDALAAEGIGSDWVQTRPGVPTDGATVIVSSVPPDRTVYWHKGARLVRGDRLHITGIFGQDVVLLDVDDAPLRRFLVDLPAHTLPTARILGTLGYLVDPTESDAFEIALRYDVLVGNRRELLALTGKSSLDDAISYVQAAMPGANLRAGVVTKGADGASAFTRSDRWDAPANSVSVIDPTGAGDAFAGAVAYAMALRWEWPAVIQFANAVAAHSTTALGAQTALPTWDETMALLIQHV